MDKITFLAARFNLFSDNTINVEKACNALKDLIDRTYITEHEIKDDSLKNHKVSF